MKERWTGSSRIALSLILAGIVSATARAERIDFMGPYVDGQLVTQVQQGTSFSLLARLTDNEEIPLFGYSLNVDVSAVPGSIGSVFGDAEASTFYEQRNLIAAGGGTLHPDLSRIIDPGDKGLFVNGVNIDPIPVQLSQPGVNDILAELVFVASGDALGFFLFDLGPGSVLSHVPKFELPFETIPKMVEVIPVPEPTTIIGLVFAGVLFRRYRGRRLNLT